MPACWLLLGRGGSGGEGRAGEERGGKKQEDEKYVVCDFVSDDGRAQSKLVFVFWPRFTCSHFCFCESGRVAIVVVSVASLTMDPRPVVYKVIECTCGAKWYWWGVPHDTDVGLPHVRLQIISHTMSEGHTAMSLEDIAAMRWMYAPNARCRWFRRRIAGGSDSSLSVRDHSPMSSLSD